MPGKVLAGEMVRQYIAEQEGESVHDDSRFVINNPTKLPPFRRQWFTFNVREGG